MLVPMEGDRTPEPLIATPAHEGSPRFSPDGNWLTYTSDETGRFEVYVTPFPGPPSVNLVSRGGGLNAVWAHDGNTIYYRQGDKMMAAPFGGGSWPEPLIGDPELLFEGRYNGRADLRPRYDIGPEGEDFLMLAGSEQQWPNEINVVLNWTTALLR